MSVRKGMNPMNSKHQLKLKQVVGVVAHVAVAVAIAAGSVACGSSSTPPSASTAAPPVAAATATITIDNFKFASPPSVSPGATVAVKNADPMEHSVTADSGNAFSVDIDGGESATFTAPTTPGTYNYHCSYHPMMHGQLIVK
jgi:plastocyanin